MNQIPQVMVTLRDGAWWAVCGRPGCGFSFSHIRRHVVDDQAIEHQNKGHRKAGSG